MPATVALPRLHIRPGYGWLNDPNGMAHVDGCWHVFFQHNPQAPVHNRIQWGHVSSADLVTWTEHPVAFGPQEGGPDDFGCWSGVFAPGLARPAVVYSGVAASDGQSTVCLRWGSADLLDWSDPIVVARTPPGVQIMRDPFLFSWGERRWALLGAELAEGGPAILLYDCADMLAWQPAGHFAHHRDPVLDGLPRADIWECPQLLQVGEQTALIVSRWLAEELLEVFWVGGAITDRDGTPAFVADTAAGWGVLDAGTSCYAPQLVNTGDGSLLLGWVRSRPDQAPEVPVAGCLTFPRRLHLDHGRVVCVLDPGVAAALLASATVENVGSGRHTVEGQCVVVPAADATLTSAGDPGLVVAVPVGAQAWIDADILEVYAAPSPSPSSPNPPATYRGLGGWVLDLPTGTAALHRLPG